LCSSGLRGQDAAKKILPGVLGVILSVLVSVLIVFGGIVFNIGNVGGGGLGLNALVGLPLIPGYILTALLAIAIFIFKQAKSIMDTVTKVLGGLMIVLILIVIFIVQPPVGDALKNTVAPSAGYFSPSMSSAILTLLGGTVGGYITFAGAHRLIDAGTTGKDRLPDVNKSAVMGIGIATIVRILLFLAILGVVAKGAVDINAAAAGDISNPAATAFRIGAGELGYRFAGLVIFCAAITSVIGCSYTSISFMKSIKFVDEHENAFVIGFIVLSCVVMCAMGAAPATLLVLAGAINGLILPITLAVCLIAGKMKKVMGESYNHPMVLWILGWVVVVVSGYLGVTTFVSKMATLF
ncbi:MAG: divalent metal cation transporter, partial [Oscillospiraceae bacterium]|nr:divalent metal cation transporter [Oscillospiraceae bacterium]